MNTRPLEPGRLAVRKDPRHRNPNGWAVVSNEPVPHWTGRRRVGFEEHSGLYVYPFKSWHSAVLRSQREGRRRAMLELHRSGALQVDGLTNVVHLNVKGWELQA